MHSLMFYKPYTISFPVYWPLYSLWHYLLHTKHQSIRLSLLKYCVQDAYIHSTEDKTRREEAQNKHPYLNNLHFLQLFRLPHCSHRNASIYFHMHILILWYSFHLIQTYRSIYMCVCLFVDWASKCWVCTGLLSYSHIFVREIEVVYIPKPHRVLLRVICTKCTTQQSVIVYVSI